MPEGRHRMGSGPPPPPPPPARENTPIPQPPPLGPRRSRLQDRKRDRRKRTLSTGAAGTVAAVVAAGALALFVAGNGDTGDAAPQPTITAAPDDPVTTTLLFGTREQQRDSRKEAIWMTLLSYDSEAQKGAVVYVPAHTAVEVPGRGLQGLGEVLGGGGVPLLLVGAENLLGVGIDRYVELSDRDARVLFDALGPLSVDVPNEVRVPAGRDRTRLMFGEGQQQLPPLFLVRLLYTLGIDGDDVDLGSRHLAFWDSLFETFNEDPENLAQAIRGAGPALNESDASLDDHSVFFEILASLERSELTITSLPVEQVSVGGSELYDTDEDEIRDFMAASIGAVQPPTDEIRIQVLNGNGVPGIGQQAAERLVGQGYRVILSGNASRLNYRRTLIVTYDSSDSALSLARQTRDLLGVGEVQVSGVQQGIVDMTIVIGKDFLRTL